DPRGHAARGDTNYPPVTRADLRLASDQTLGHRSVKASGRIPSSIQADHDVGSVPTLRRRHDCGGRAATGAHCGTVDTAGPTTPCRAHRPHARGIASKKL